jgi:hypothetical protein
MQNPPVPGGMPPPGSAGAKDAVNAPATLLIVTAIIGILAQLASIVATATGMGQQTPEQMAQMPEQFRAYMEASQRFGVVGPIIGIVAGAFVLFAALKLKNLESRGLAMAGAIVAMIPCISPCCCLGLPVGIWALVVMNRPDVSASFRA